MLYSTFYINEINTVSIYSDAGSGNSYKVKGQHLFLVSMSLKLWILCVVELKSHQD